MNFIYKLSLAPLMILHVMNFIYLFDTVLC